MTRMLKTLFDRKKKEPSPEEVEADLAARMALKVRVEQMIRNTGRELAA
jgi:hypothetical protein